MTMLTVAMLYLLTADVTAGVMAVGHSCTVWLLARSCRRSGTTCICAAGPHIITVCCQAAQLLVLLGTPADQRGVVTLKRGK